MGNLFYNIMSLILGVSIFSYGILSFTKKRNLLLLFLALLHGAILIASGIVGFIIPDNYSFIVTIIMFVFTVSYILILVFLDQKNPIVKPKEEKEENKEVVEEKQIKEDNEE